MKIYDMEGLPNPMRVRIALREKGASDLIKFVAVDVLAGEHRREPLRTKNPDMTVPFAELECGTCISQCSAIIEYIDGAYPGPSLIGDTPKQRAITQMMNLRAEAGLVDAVGAYFHNATTGLGPDLELNQIPEWGEKQKERAVRTMHLFNQTLSQQPYLAGQTFSTADITAFAGLAFADFAHVSIPDGLTNLRAWRDRVAERRSCQG